MGSLSDLRLKALLKSAIPIAVSDGDGLTFTLSQAGTAAWVLRFRIDGRRKELSLGRYPDIGLAHAREIASAERAKVQQGIDVAREKQLRKLSRAAASSTTELARDYMAKVFPRLAPNTVSQRRRHIEKLILPKLGSIPAREVTTGDVIDLVEGIAKKSASVAELVLTACSEIFKHGIARHVVTSNPCASISLSAICGKTDPKRARLMLSEAELRIILPALPAMGIENALAVKILLGTCVRIGELVRAKWEDVNLDRGEWHVTDVNSKTGKGFTIPLTRAAVGWFTELKRLACESPYVMPARQTRRKDHCEPRSINAMIHKFCNRLEKNRTPVRRFTPHDLRSTARSWLTSDLIGASVVVAERCLNHTLGGLVAVYDQHDYLTERRAVLERWTEMITACETGQPWTQASKKVVPIKRDAA